MATYIELLNDNTLVKALHAKIDSVTLPFKHELFDFLYTTTEYNWYQCYLMPLIIATVRRHGYTSVRQFTSMATIFAEK